NRHNLGKSLIAARPIKKGARLTIDDIAIASPGSGLHPKYKHLLIGRTTERTFQIGDLFFDSDLKNKKTVNKSFNYERPFGIPVRYHDFDLLTKDAGVTLIEFHLSYKDIELDVNDFLNKKYEYQLVVHCPELFANDHLLDLASSSNDYRSKSIDNVNRTLDLTRRLNGFFVNQYKTPFVINVGGWSTESFVDEDVISEKIDNLEKSLLNLDLSDVELSVQTMPPFPWHFGGQAFHNLFVKPEQIISLAKQLGVSICLDTSHTMMAANYYGFDFYDAVKDLLLYASHLHISDAEGIDGEGTNLCDGDINFYELSKILNNHLEIGFIPEIWQGHLDFGAKFWSALNELEQFGLN
ncbi:MAG: TIM barrel protein, partial [Paracoccaceae bacterium]